MTDRHNNLPDLPEDIESYDASAFGRAADSFMDGNVSPADAAWELEKQKAREWAERWVPRTQLTRRQAQ